MAVRNRAGNRATPGIICFIRFRRGMDLWRRQRRRSRRLKPTASLRSSIIRSTLSKNRTIRSASSNIFRIRLKVNPTPPNTCAPVILIIIIIIVKIVFRFDGKDFFSNCWTRMRIMFRSSQCCVHPHVPRASAQRIPVLHQPIQRHFPTANGRKCGEYFFRIANSGGQHSGASALLDADAEAPDVGRRAASSADEGCCLTLFKGSFSPPPYYFCFSFVDY